LDRIDNIAANHEKRHAVPRQYLHLLWSGWTRRAAFSQAAFSVHGAFRNYRNVRDRILTIKGINKNQIIIFNGNFSIQRQLQVADLQQNPSQL
jgi:hypothetical protein